MKKLVVILLLGSLSVQAQISVEVKGIFHSSNYASFLSVPRNHHFIASKQGSAASKALITTDLSDLDIYNRLIAAGAKAGNNLTLQTWTERKNPNHSDPDLSVKGNTIKIEMVRQDGSVYKPEDLFTDKFHKGFLFKFGGNLAFRQTFNSGSMVCLQSCPDGKISNSAYTMREFSKDQSLFPLKSPSPIKDGESIVVRFIIEN